VRGVLSSRIDRLPLLEKRVLYAAAIVGRTFTADRVAMLVDDASEPEILDALQALRLADFIEEQWLSQKPAFKFKHFLTLEVAYQTQLIAHRRRAHARLAEAITSAQLEPEGEQSALVASHWERADRPFHAAQAWARAAPHEPLGDRLRVWERVRELLSREESAGEAKSLELTAVAQSLSLGWSHGLRGDEAQSLFDRGVELTRGEPNETTVRAILHAHFGRTRLSTEGAPSYVQSLEHALTHARNVEWPLLADGISAGLCQGLAYSGELPRALALADEVLPRLLSSKGSGFKQSGFDISPDLWLRAVRAEVLALMGRHADSATELDDVIEESLRTGQIELLVLPRFTKLRLEWLRDAPSKDDPEPLAEATLRVARDLGSDRSLVMAHGAMGIAAQLAGDPERAAREFTTALELTRDRLAGPELEPLLASHLADARLGMGDAREASASARAAVGTARERGLRVFECMASIELARAALLTESSAVESIAQDCMRLCEQTAAHALRGRLERLVLAAT
jgi:hypothetical protein